MKLSKLLSCQTKFKGSCIYKQLSIRFHLLRILFFFFRYFFVVFFYTTDHPFICLSYVLYNVSFFYEVYRQNSVTLFEYIFGLIRHGNRSYIRHHDQRYTHSRIFIKKEAVWGFFSGKKFINNNRYLGIANFYDLLVLCVYFFFLLAKII